MPYISLDVSKVSTMQNKTKARRNGIIETTRAGPKAEGFSRVHTVIEMVDKNIIIPQSIKYFFRILHIFDMSSPFLCFIKAKPQEGITTMIRSLGIKSIRKVITPELQKGSPMPERKSNKPMVFFMLQFLRDTKG